MPQCTKLAVDSTHHNHGPQPVPSNDDSAKKSVGSDRSIGQSSLHPCQQENKIARKGRRAASPHWEKKGSYDSNVHNLVSLTIRRSRSRPVVSSNDTNGASVPKFGDWDEANPSSADRFSQIFEMVREEKLSGGEKVPPLWAETSNSNTRKRHTAAICQSCCCFPWSRK